MAGTFFAVVHSPRGSADAPALRRAATLPEGLGRIDPAATSIGETDWENDFLLLAF